MYVVYETQTTHGVMSVVPPEVKATWELALQEFHVRCSYAAVSSVEIHTIMVVMPDGTVKKTETFMHIVEAAQ